MKETNIQELLVNTITELFLDYKDGKKLMCPRCGWLKGGWGHCGLCEGSEEEIVDWYKRLLNKAFELGKLLPISQSINKIKK